MNGGLGAARGRVRLLPAVGLAVPGTAGPGSPGGGLQPVSRQGTAPTSERMHCGRPARMWPSASAIITATARPIRVLMRAWPRDEGVLEAEVPVDPPVDPLARGAPLVAPPPGTGCHAASGVKMRRFPARQVDAHDAPPSPRPSRRPDARTPRAPCFRGHRPRPGSGTSGSRKRRVPPRSPGRPSTAAPRLRALAEHFSLLRVHHGIGALRKQRPRDRLAGIRSPAPPSPGATTRACRSADGCRGRPLSRAFSGPLSKPRFGAEIRTPRRQARRRREQRAEHPLQRLHFRGRSTRHRKGPPEPHGAHRRSGAARNRTTSFTVRHAVPVRASGPPLS